MPDKKKPGGVKYLLVKILYVLLYDICILLAIILFLKLGLL